MKKDVVRVRAGDDMLPDILQLIQKSFAYMDGVIDPPSSMHQLTVSDISRQCESGEVWAIGHPPVACAFFTIKSDCLYVGKLSVASGHRGEGLSRQLVALAEDRAVALGKPWLELQTRIELLDNHRIFAALGFVKTLETAHAGYDRPTSITMRRPVPGVRQPEADQTCADAVSPSIG